MGSSFVAAISSEPVVVLIDDQSILATWLEEYFLESGLAVCRVDVSALEITLAQLDSQGREIYKFVCLNGFVPHSTWLKDLAKKTDVLEKYQRLFKSAAEILSARSEPLVVITHQTSLDLSDFTSPIALALQQLITFERRIIERFQATGRAQIFVGVDTLDYTDGIELPLLYPVLGLKNGVLFNPENNWFIQPISAFYRVIVNQLIKPHQVQTVLVRGKARLSTYWLNKIGYLYLQYFSERPSIVSTPVETFVDIDLAEAVNCQTNEVVQEVLDLKTRALPSLLVEIDEINRDLRETEQAEIQLSVRDLVSRTSTPTYIDESAKDANGVKNSSLDLSSPSNLGIEIEPEKPILSKSSENNGLNNQSKNLKISGKNLTNEVIVERWGSVNDFEDLIDESIKNPEKTTDNSEDKGVIYVDKELQKIFSSTRLNQRKDRTVQKVKSTKKIIFKSKRHRMLFYGGLTLVSIGGMVGLLAGLYHLSVIQARNVALGEFQNYVNSQKFADFSNGWASFLSFQTKNYAKAVKEDMLSGGQTVVDMAEASRILTETQQKVISEQKHWFSGLQGGGEYDVEKSAASLVELVGKEHIELEKLSSLMANIDIADLSGKQQETLNKTKKELNTDLDAVMASARFLQIAPDLLGIKEKKTYAVLVQNDLELRPTGGFIQNVILLTFNRGVLVDSQVYSTYEIDNKLASNVKPPDEIKQVLGEQRWFLRDSNWNPDLPASAKQANWFMEESLGRSVDGVIALNYSTISNILKVTGPLVLNEFNEEVTDKNIYDKLEFHAEGKVQNTAGKKVEYTNVLLTQLLAELKKMSPDKVPALFTALYDDFQHRELNWVVFKKEESQVFKELGWDGSVVTPKCPSQFLESTCVLDTLYQVDANVGVNKVNGYLEKHVKDQVEVGLKTVSHQRTISYTNNAKLDLWPQGTYRAFVKFYLPNEAQLQALQVNSIAVSTDKVTIYSENGQKIVGFILEVPKQKTVAVNLQYQLTHSYDKPFSYFFFSQRQPGDKSERDVNVKLDKGLRARVVSPEIEMNDSGMEFLIPKFDHAIVGVTVE